LSSFAQRQRRNDGERGLCRRNAHVRRQRILDVARVTAADRGGGAELRLRPSHTTTAEQNHSNAGLSRAARSRRLHAPARGRLNATPRALSAPYHLQISGHAARRRLGSFPRHPPALPACTMYTMVITRACGNRMARPPLPFRRRPCFDPRMAPRHRRKEFVQVDCFASWHQLDALSTAETHGGDGCQCSIWRMTM